VYVALKMCAASKKTVALNKSIFFVGNKIYFFPLTKTEMSFPSFQLCRGERTHIPNWLPHLLRDEEQIIVRTPTSPVVTSVLSSISRLICRSIASIHPHCSLSLSFIAILCHCVFFHLCMVRCSIAHFSHSFM